MARELHDHFFHRAKREGLRSRAAYKLLEIDERRRVLEPGDAVLDCGAAPGSWCQVAAGVVGPEGAIVGIDLQRIEPIPSEVPITLLQGDLETARDDELLTPIRPGREQFDVVLSDMAPSTIGDRTADHHRSVRLCELVLDRAAGLLRPGGRLVMKVLEGEAYPGLIERTRGCFARVRGFRPRASRAVSTEMFVIAHGFEPGDAGGAASRPTDAGSPPPPSPGWGD